MTWKCNISVAAALTDFMEEASEGKLQVWRQTEEQFNDMHHTLQTMQPLKKKTQKKKTQKKNTQTNELLNQLRISRDQLTWAPPARFSSSPLWRADRPCWNVSWQAERKTQETMRLRPNHDASQLVSSLQTIGRCDARCWTHETNTKWDFVMALVRGCACGI